MSQFAKFAARIPAAGLLTPLGASLVLALGAILPAQAEEDILSPQEAFRYEVSADVEQITVRWDIEPGYYMYRGRMRYSTATAGIALGDVAFSKGKVKDDEFFGEVEIYRKQAQVTIPYEAAAGVHVLSLEIRSQGCADVGLCYPPETWTADVALPATSAGQGANLLDLAPGAAAPAADAIAAPLADPLMDALGAGVTGSPAGSPGSGINITGDAYLPPEQAFAFHTEIVDAFTVRAVWTIADGYYLYRDKFAFETDAPGIDLQPAQLPDGKAKHDEHFGLVAVFHDRAEAIVPISREERGSAEFTLRASYQGCAEQGICYPPSQTESLVLLPAIGDGSTPGGTYRVDASFDGGDSGLPASEQNLLVQTITEGNVLYMIGIFFGFGLLLAFTPCVFPMFPILSGIIIGQQGSGEGESASTQRAFSLSMAYVLAMASTYTVAGVVTAMLGANLQAAFQHPAVLISFAALFAVLSLSMFGVYELQMPAGVQSRLMALSNRQEGGSLVGVAAMGALSALIVGPCMAAPLASALIVIGQGGDPLRGGIALFALGLGMGAPLVAYGTSAGKLLPRAGAWMERVKTFFGIGMLAVSVLMLSRILPAAATMGLWAALAIGGGLAFGGFAPFVRGGTPTPAGVRIAGGALAAYGAVLLGGLLLVGSTDPLDPLRRHEAKHLDFTRIASVSELESEVARAGAAGQLVMLDFYADWCTSCKEMEKHTFTDASVQAALNGAVLLQADVTANNADDKALLKYFEIYGPPTIAFFAADGRELRNARVVGFMPAENFQAHVSAVVAAGASHDREGGARLSSASISD
ncbi:MAG: protein-disulfide reductase DsbD [Pseudomonadota bacterium]